MYKQIAAMAVRLLLVIGWIALLAPQASIVLAQSTNPPVNPLEPQVPGTSPQVPQTFPQPEEEILSEQVLQFASPLRAVIFVGPIDGNTGKGTLEQISYAQQTAQALRRYNVSVQEFYPNNANATWANIKAAAQGAHFVIYRGHGVSIANTSPMYVGGFWLRSNEYVSSDQIRAELRPAKNFIVMMYGSYTAGSTSSEPVSINQDEAKRRVAMYSDPFFDIGAGAYYADWFGDAFTSYVNSLFQGKSHRQAYSGFYDYDGSRTWFTAHPDHPALSMWLGWDEWYDPKPQWNNVFIGQPDTTIQNMFTEMNRSLTRTLFIPTVRR